MPLGIVKGLRELEHGSRAGRDTESVTFIKIKIGFSTWVRCLTTLLGSAATPAAKAAFSGLLGGRPVLNDTPRLLQ